MKERTKQKSVRKELPTAIKLILILMFAFAFLGFGICVGFLINAFVEQSIEEILAHVALTLLLGAIYMTILMVLIRDSDIERIKPRKWYVNCILISCTLNLIITAITVFTLGSYGSEINYLIGFAIFPFIGICTTPNIVKHVKKDTSNWKKIFYKNGNIHTIKNSPDYYRVKTPVEFEERILSAVRKHQLLSLLIVIVVIFLLIFLSVNFLAKDHNYTDNLFINLIVTRQRRGLGFVFFLMIFLLAFAIPIIAYYVANALKR